MAQGRAYQVSDADRTFVERAVMAGTPIEKIAECLNVHDDTLRKHFRYEIMTGRERLKGNAIRVLVDSLTDGSLDAAKFVLARVAGWTEKPEAVSQLTVNIPFDGWETKRAQPNPPDAD